LFWVTFISTQLSELSKKFCGLLTAKYSCHKLQCQKIVICVCALCGIAIVVVV